jgi:hypothetical protein
MAASYIVEDPDPNNFVVIHVGEKRRYVFPRLPGLEGRVLQPAAWTRQDARSHRTLLTGAARIRRARGAELGADRLSRNQFREAAAQSPRASLKNQILLVGDGFLSCIPIHSQTRIRRRTHRRPDALPGETILQTGWHSSSSAP